MTWRRLENTWLRYRLSLLAALFSLMFLIPSAQMWTAPVARSAGEGQALFEEKCAACHTIGGGNRVGPDLKGVTTLRDRDWLVRWIAAPDKMLAQKDPLAIKITQQFNNLPMPNLGLTGDQVSALVSYLENPAGGATTPPAATAGQGARQPLAKGDPATGKDLFTGAVGFQNGGPACMACHSIAGIGALGGGAMGPDLTDAYGKYGDSGIASVLATLPFPTMNPIFASRPLTPEEQANLWAFFQAAAVAQRPAEAVGQLGLLAVVGAAILILVAHLFFRRRLAQVRRPMVAQPTAVSRQQALSGRRPNRR